jgi:malate dehydrogenase (oxaloacetate-decarboxylating)(NADP+)
MEVLDYHEGSRPGKCRWRWKWSRRSLVRHAARPVAGDYTRPGVAIPCLRIEQDPLEAFRYTGRGNLVAVVSNGTAVLGLGNIGALAGKPVMEGKGVLFKRFAMSTCSTSRSTRKTPTRSSAVKLLEPTFGGINLEDIKAPECFYIEETLQRDGHPGLPR